MAVGNQNDCFRVGLIGFGIGKIYASAFSSVNLFYQDLPAVELTAVATASSDSATAAVKQFGFHWSTQRYQDLLDNPDIHAVIIASPTDQHFPMLRDALRSGKAIYTDKPLTRTMAEAEEILEISEAAGHDAQIIFQYRSCPAIIHAAQLIQSGEIGKIQSFRWWHYRSSYVNPEKPLRWKGSFSTSGGGVIPDLMSHSFDMLIWMLGMPIRLSALGRTFINERPIAKASKVRATISTEDHAVVLSELAGGAIGTLEAGRMAVGTVNDMGFEIFGSRGSLRWEAMNPNYLQYSGPGLEAANGGRAFIPTMQKLPGATWLPQDLSVGTMQFYVASAADFISRTVSRVPYDVNIKQGVRVQALIKAAVQSLHNQGVWITPLE